MNYERQSQIVCEKGFCEYEDLYDKRLLKTKDKASFFILTFVKNKKIDIISLEKCSDGKISVNFVTQNNGIQRKLTLKSGFTNYVAASTYYMRVLCEEFPQAFVLLNR
jgi:hypothetical protein